MLYNVSSCVPQGSAD